jgi:glucan phosphorylase
LTIGVPGVCRVQTRLFFRDFEWVRVLTDKNRPVHDFAGKASGDDAENSSSAKSSISRAAGPVRKVIFIEDYDINAPADGWGHGLACTPGVR